MNLTEKQTLEAMFERHGPNTILLAIGELCRAKAEELNETLPKQVERIATLEELAEEVEAAASPN